MNKNRNVSTLITIFLIVVLVLANFLTKGRIISFTGQIISPVGIVFSDTAGKITGFFHNVGSIGGLQRENKELKDQLNAALVEVASLTEMKTQNEALKRDLEFKTSTGFTLAPAMVVSYDPSIRDGLTLLLDNSGDIKTGSAVVSQGFFVGRVQSVQGRLVRVTVITDSSSAIPANIMGKEYTGVAAGQIGDGLTLDQVPQNDLVSEGQFVVTSGLHGDLPKGIIIGKVSKIEKTSGSIFQHIELKPMIDISRIDRAMIVIQ